MKVMFCRWGTTLVTPYMKPPTVKGTDDSSDEGEGEDGSNVAEEVLLLHCIASMEDDRRKKDVEEDLWVECGLLIDLIVRSISNFAFEFVQPSFILELLNGAHLA